MYVLAVAERKEPVRLRTECRRGGAEDADDGTEGCRGRQHQHGRRVTFLLFSQC